MIGLNENILSQYVEYITNLRMKSVGLQPAFPEQTHNPIPWINTWLSSDNVQVAPQEVEVSSYLVSQIDSKVSTDDLGGFELWAKKSTSRPILQGSRMPKMKAFWNLWKPLGVLSNTNAAKGCAAAAAASLPLVKSVTCSHH